MEKAAIHLPLAVPYRRRCNRSEKESKDNLGLFQFRDGEIRIHAGDG